MTTINQPTVIEKTRAMFEKFKDVENISVIVRDTHKQPTGSPRRYFNTKASFAMTIDEFNRLNYSVNDHSPSTVMIEAEGEYFDENGVRFKGEFFFEVKVYGTDLKVELAIIASDPFGNEVESIFDIRLEEIKITQAKRFRGNL